MGAQSIVRHQLGLVLRLIDSTTGRGIPERDIRFRTEPAVGKPVVRGDGVYLFLNTGETDFTIEVRVYGYEPAKAEILFDRIDSNPPIRELYLLPLDYPAEGGEILTLRGNMPGIQAIEAVSLSQADCCIREFAAAKRIMKVLNQHNVKLPHVHYGLIGKDQTYYEHFEIEEEISTQEVRLKRKLELEYTINQPISRVIFGQIGEGGDYMLKVRAGRNAVYLIRYVTDGTVRFQKMDFHRPESLNGAEGPEITQ